MAKVEDCPGFETFGADVKEARKAKNLARKDLAEKVNIDTRYLANIENEGTIPSLPVIIQLVKICGLPMERYFNPEVMREESELRQRVGQKLKLCPEQYLPNPGDWNDHRFREVSDHRKDAAVPCQRRLSHFTGDLAYFGIDRIEHARQVSRDPLDEQPSEPFIEFVEYAAHKRSPPDDQPNRPESRGTRVMPMRATPPPAINCFIPWLFTYVR